MEFGRTKAAASLRSARGDRKVATPGSLRSLGGRNTAAPCRRSYAGFTLLEVLVAVSILGLGVAVTMQTFSGGLKNVRRIDLAHQAMGHAENIMNRLLSDEDLVAPSNWTETWTTSSTTRPRWTSGNRPSGDSPWRSPSRP